MRSVNSPPAFDTSQIPAVDRRNLAATFLEAIRAFYKDPAHLEEFERWKKERDSKPE